MDTKMRESDFPYTELVLAAIIGLPGVIVGLLCTLQLVSYLGPRFDVVIVNDHVIGGTSDQTFLFYVGSVSGAVGLFAGLRFWHRFSEWQRRTRRSETGVVPR
jgi:hypothetical protein